MPAWDVFDLFDFETKQGWVKEFCYIAFRENEMEIEWGQGLGEGKQAFVIRLSESNMEHVRVSCFFPQCSPPQLEGCTDQDFITFWKAGVRVEVFQLEEVF